MSSLLNKCIKNVVWNKTTYQNNILTNTAKYSYYDNNPTFFRCGEDPIPSNAEYCPECNTWVQFNIKYIFNETNIE